MLKKIVTIKIMFAMRLIQKKLILAFFTFLIFVTAGCQQYHPLPLDEKEVAKALTMPDEQVLKVKAETLSHPMIHPIKLDFSNGLSPDEAAVLAVLINPSLKVVRDRRGIAAGELIDAGILPNPSLGLSMDIPTRSNPPDTFRGYTAGLGWDVSEILARGAKIKAATKNKSSVDLDVAWQEWQVSQAAKQAVYDLYSLKKQIALAQESDNRLKENLKTVKEALQQGLMTEMYYSAAETASYQAHSIVLDLRKQISEQGLMMKQALGFDIDANTIIEKDINLPATLKVPGNGELVKNIEKQRLDLIALKYGYESQQENLRAAVINQFPKVNIGFNKARDTGDVKTIGYELSVELPIFNRNQGQIAIQKATRQQLFDEYVSRIFDTKNSIAKLTANIPIIIEQIKTIEAETVSGKKLVETYRIATEKGQADVLSYYTAWNDLTQNQIEVYKLKQQLIDSRIALELETGLYNIEDMNKPNLKAIEYNEANK
jgi:outer membrane protein, heavy metal efflux system